MASNATANRPEPALLVPFLLVLPGGTFACFVFATRPLEMPAYREILFAFYCFNAILALLWTALSRPRAVVLASGLTTAASLLILALFYLAYDGEAGHLLLIIGIFLGAVALLTAVLALPFEQVPVRARRVFAYLLVCLLGVLAVIVADKVLQMSRHYSIIGLLAVVLCAASTWGGLLFRMHLSLDFRRILSIVATGLSLVVLSETLRTVRPAWSPNVVIALGELGRFAGYFFAAVGLSLLSRKATFKEQEIGDSGGVEKRRL